MKYLLPFSIISFFLFLAGISYYVLSPHQTAINSHTEPLQSFEYKITYINHDGINAISTKDSSKLFITPDKVKGIRLHVTDLIKVYFPLHGSKSIIKVEKEETIVYNFPPK